MDGSSNHNRQQRQSCNGQRLWGCATAAQWVAGRQSNCNGQRDGSSRMVDTMGGGQSPVDTGMKMEAMLGFWLVGVL
jgi:hypothetical protein